MRLVDPSASSAIRRIALIGAALAGLGATCEAEPASVPWQIRLGDGENQPVGDDIVKTDDVGAVTEVVLAEILVESCEPALDASNVVYREALRKDHPIPTPPRLKRSTYCFTAQGFAATCSQTTDRSNGLVVLPDPDGRDLAVVHNLYFLNLDDTVVCTAEEACESGECIPSSDEDDGGAGDGMADAD